MVNFQKKFNKKQKQEEKEQDKFTMVETDPQQAKEIITEEKVFRKGVLSVRDLISPASLKVSPSFLRLGQLIC